MRTILIATALAALLPAAASAATFQNGGFETASVDPGSGFVTLNNGSTAITGWTVIGNNIDYIGGYWEAAEGDRSIDLNGLNSGGIQQTFDTISGRTYRVVFSLAGNPDGGPTQKVVSTVATGSSSASYTFDTTGATRTDMGWAPFVYTFVADGTTTTLGFTSSIGGSYGAALDAVSVSGAVPEPATWALMILGFGAVGGALRRRTPAMRPRLA